jgi:hypothetical protein
VCLAVPLRPLGLGPIGKGSVICVSERCSSEPAIGCSLQRTEFAVRPPLPGVATQVSLLLLGLALGMRHALEPDHVAAVAALATRSHTVQHTVWQGVIWGIGHTVTLLFFGGVVLALHATVPQKLAAALEFLVGMMLIVLAFDVLRGAVHVHAHSHACDSTAHVLQCWGAFPLRALCVGMMHGMAGTAALIVMVVGGAPSLTFGLAQIIAFGLGSIVGMAGLSLAIAVPMRWSTGTLAPFHRVLRYAVAVATLALGSTMLYEVASRQ